MQNDFNMISLGDDVQNEQIVDNFSTSPKVATIARIGVLGALSAVLYAIPGIPVFPPIYKIDFSTLPALLGGMAMGNTASLLILLIKDLTGLLHSSSMGVGEIADFLMSGAMCVALCSVYGKKRDRNGALLGIGLGVIATVLMSLFANAALLIPFYINVMHLPEDAIVGMMAKLVPQVTSIRTMLAWVVAPFNALKGVILGVLTLLLYRPLHALLETNRHV